MEDKLAIDSDDNVSSVEKMALSSELRDELTEKLKEALDSMEPEECGLIINEFSKYTLSEQDKETFDNIKLFVEEYDFDEALALL